MSLFLIHITTPVAPLLAHLGLNVGIMQIASDLRPQFNRPKPNSFPEATAKEPAEPDMRCIAPVVPTA